MAQGSAAGAVRAGVRASHPRAAGDRRGARLRGMADRAEAIRGRRARPTSRAGGGQPSRLETYWSVRPG